jgi:hypothetical protein
MKMILLIVCVEVVEGEEGEEVQQLTLRCYRVFLAPLSSGSFTVRGAR